MHVFYQPNLLLDEICLSEDESKHAIRVLRMQVGSIIDLTNGKGLHAQARVIDANPKKCIAVITNKEQHQPKRNFYLHVAVAPTKNFDRIEWAIEKLTEIGIDEISFVETKNSERNKINLERCYKIATSAMKQSKQWYLPQINNIMPLHEFFKAPLNADIKLLAWCETNKLYNLSEQFNSNSIQQKRILVLIGPEGDFTSSEVSLAGLAGFTPLWLGGTILRTETAAVVACVQIHQCAIK